MDGRKEREERGDGKGERNSPKVTANRINTVPIPSTGWVEA